ncbi:MAG: Holliday junction branch migration protein RuvA [Fimbriimonas ginsengisoli]|uniref:Holliday junction branch migration complex subunit RuvA n=1 Tax=Fimbriimonas ginsengisoli TaxID=1005039 RepID=A0A931LUG3_FIMGI|nr:Holliday junction branch migration protein RuvA [Fimbriimonas ginsengisoli]
MRGELTEVVGSIALVDVAGVGYEVQIPDSVLMRLPAPGHPVDLRIRQIFREDAVSLYGFLEAYERRLFDLLIEVKGCGPKIALSLIGQLGAESVSSAILSQDARALIRASGVGQKLAERLILELREKLGQEAFRLRLEAAATPGGAPPDELVDALLALGYRRVEAESAASEARDQAEDVEDQLRVALRSLRR